MREPLFSERDRTDDSYRRHDETTIQFLDRVDDALFARVRLLLNDWFSELADEDKAERLRADLYSARDPQVEGAVWELFLHAAFRRSSLEVELEPGRDEGRQPDFCVWPTDAPDLETLVEARSIGDPPTVRASEQRLARVFDSVNEATPPGFMVHIRHIDAGSQSPSGVRLRRQMVAWLRTLDRETERLALQNGGTVCEQTFVIGDSRFDVRAIALSSDEVDPRHRLIGIGPVRFGTGGSTSTLRSALDAKASLDTEGKPYVIAVANTHAFLDEEDIPSVLFGQPALAIRGENSDGSLITENVRHGDGYFRSDTHTRVSAVLYAPRFQPWMLPDLVPELWLNPWARSPTKLRLRWARTVSTSEEGSLVKMEPGVTLLELFGLPSDWPGPERSFEARRKRTESGDEAS